MLLGFLLCGLLSAGPQSKAGLKPSVLASTGPLFRSFASGPAANSHGLAVFKAVRPDGREGIYGAAGLNILFVAETGGIVDDGPERHVLSSVGNHPLVGSAMRVFFLAGFRGGGRGILTRQGAAGPYRFWADSGEGFDDFDPRMVLNGKGELLFAASIVPESGEAPERDTLRGRQRQMHNGMFLDKGGDLQVIGGSDQDFLELMSGFGLNDRGAVAYRAHDVTRRLVLYIKTGGAPAFPLLRVGHLYQDLGPPSVNPQGNVFCRVQTTQAAAQIVRCTYGVGQPVVLLGGQYAGYRDEVAVDPYGFAAAVGHRKEGGDALVLIDARKGGGVPVLQSGDAVGQEVVKEIYISPQAFAGRGRLVALVKYESKAEAILRLDSMRNP